MSERQGAENTYMGEVLKQQEKVERELRWRSAPAPANRAQQTLTAPGSPAVATQPNRAIDYRISGFWRWKTVLVPPNVYVVHTRRGHAEPVTVGMGISFGFDPYRDAFLLVPATLQTIIINARCICNERQGILVQAYVQWIIDDIGTAYRRLDFSDTEDPMRIVNVQLREQAEAAIKDKVSTMGVDEVLSDKQPIIEELTHRLRQVAEGNRESNSGLGLKIVTVQIKEAVVSSTRVWESLQKPFRAEREKIARLAELTAQQEIAGRELQSRQAGETSEIQSAKELAQLRAAQEQERYDLEQAEKARRHQVEQDAEQRAIAERNKTDMTRKQADLDLALTDFDLLGRRLEKEIAAVQNQGKVDAVQAERDRARVAAETATEELRFKAQTLREEREIQLFKERRSVENDLTESHVRAQLIARLPEIAQVLPQPAELRSVNISSNGNGGSAADLIGLLSGLFSVAQNAFKKPSSETNGAPTSGG